MFEIVAKDRNCKQHSHDDEGLKEWNTYPENLMLEHCVSLKRSLLALSHTTCNFPLKFSMSVLPPFFLYRDKIGESKGQHNPLEIIALSLKNKHIFCQQRLKRGLNQTIYGCIHICFTYSSIYISRRVPIWVCQHGDNTNHDGFHRVDGQPALLCLLIAILVLSRLV